MQTSLNAQQENMMIGREIPWDKQWKERVQYAEEKLALTHSPSLRSWTNVLKQLHEALQEEYLTRNQYRKCKEEKRVSELTKKGNQWRQACVKTNQLIETDQEYHDRVLFETKRKQFWDDIEH